MTRDYRALRTTFLAIPLLVTAVSFIPSAVLAAWPTDGIPLNIATDDVPQQALTTDGNSGVIVAWLNFDESYDITRVFVQRISSAGGHYWSSTGVSATSIVGTQYDPQIVSDGEGGAYVAWTDCRGSSWCSISNVYIQRFDANGSPLWATDGVRVFEGTWSGSPNLVADSEGGCIVFWASSLSISAQRFNGDGVKQWEPNGVSLCSGCNTTGDFHSVPDGEGGAILVWNNDDLAFNRPFAQRISSAGNALWASGGVLLSGNESQKSISKVVTDDDRGAFIAWSDYSSQQSPTFRAMVQHVNRDGSLLWPPNGARVSDSNISQSGPTLTHDGFGGVIVVWQEAPSSSYVILAQRLSHTGVKQWAPEGIPICDAPGSRGRASALSDGNGGAIVMFLDQRTPTWSIAGQRLGPDGERLWTSDGIVFGPGWLDDDYGPTAISDDDGGSLLIRQVATPSWRELYAHRVTSAGTTPTSVRGPSYSPRFAVGSATPNPFSSSTFFDLDVPDGSNLGVEVFDVTGTRVWKTTLNTQSGGARGFYFEGRDYSGKPLPSGVYFCRVTMRGDSITRKLVLAR